MSEKRRFSVYIVRCRDGTLYTGITTQLSARVTTHNAGKGARYTRSRRPVRLVWYKSRLTGTQARQLEYAIKQLPRSAKLDYVEKFRSRCRSNASSSME